MQEFKKFLSKGNVIDMAVGLIMATYFGAIVKSLVDDILMPPIGMLIGGAIVGVIFALPLIKSAIKRLANNPRIFSLSLPFERDPAERYVLVSPSHCAQ